MKNDATLRLSAYNSGSVQSLKKEPRLTPYLKAILTGAVNLVQQGQNGFTSRHDLDAATRYIKESASLKK